MYRRWDELVLDGAVVGDGRNPGLAWDERNFLARLVTKDDLGGRRGLFPGASDDVAILKNVSIASADRRNIFVVIVIEGAFFLDYHANNDFWRELDGCTRIFADTIEDGVSGTSLIGTIIRVGGGVIGEDWVKIGAVTKAKGDLSDFGDECVSVASGWGVNSERVDGLAVNKIAFGGFWQKTREAFDVGGMIAFRGVIFGKSRSGSE